MKELIAQLKEAAGPSRELDSKIVRALNPGSKLHEDEAYCYVLGADNTYLPIPLYTASVETVLKLVSPLGWSWRIGNLPSGGAFASLGTRPSLQCVEGATPAIALIIAYLMSKMGSTGGAKQ